MRAEGRASQHQPWRSSLAKEPLERGTRDYNWFKLQLSLRKKVLLNTEVAKVMVDFDLDWPLVIKVVGAEFELEVAIPTGARRRFW